LIYVNELKSNEFGQQALDHKKGRCEQRPFEAKKNCLKNQISSE